MPGEDLATGSKEIFLIAKAREQEGMVLSRLLLDDAWVYVHSKQGGDGEKVHVEGTIARHRLHSCDKGHAASACLCTW